MSDTAWPAVEAVLKSQKGRLTEAAGKIDQNVSDDHLRVLAGVILALLPFPVRMVLKKDTLAALLIGNRARVAAILGDGNPAADTKTKSG